MTNKYAKVTLGVVATVLIWISGCVLYTYYVRWEAERCLRIFSQFRTGSTSIEEATKDLQAFSRFEVDGTARMYGTDYPLHTYQFKNSGGHLLGLFYPTFFQVALASRQDGVVVEMSAGLFQMPFHTVTTVESIVEPQHNQALHNNASGINLNLFDPPLRMYVSLSPHASDEVRRAAYSYDLSRFTALKGCQTVYELLPTVRQYAAK